MPTYLFQCSSCGLQTNIRVATGVAHAKCTCGANADRCLPTGVRIGLTSSAEGPSQLTGFSGVDHNADRAIGEYSQQKWGEIRRRYNHKVDILQQTGAEGRDLSKTHDGSYRVMSREEREKSEMSREFHFNVLKKAKPSR